MNKPTYFIGVDVSKKTLDFAINSSGRILFHFRTSNSHSGIKQALDKLRTQNISLTDSLFCIEYTGVYSLLLSTSLVDNGYDVWMESGVRIKRSLGIQRGKNDKIDSIRISQYAYRYQDQCVSWEPMDEKISALQRLVHNRKRLMLAKDSLQVPVNEMKGSIPNEELKQLQMINKSPIQSLKKQIKVIEQAIHSLIKSDEELSHLFDLVTSVRGVGPVAAWHFITSTHGFKKIKTAKKYACYAGVAPFEHTSGTSLQGRSRVSHMANKSCKTALHLAAVASISNPCEYRDYFDRKLKEGKHKMTIINAIRNKIIHRVFACVRENRKYEDSYQHALA